MRCVVFFEREWSLDDHMMVSLGAEDVQEMGNVLA